MEITIGTFRAKKFTFLIAFLASVILHGLILIAFQKPQKGQNMAKSESVEILFARALRDTEALGKKISDSVEFTSPLQ